MKPLNQLQVLNNPDMSTAMMQVIISVAINSRFLLTGDAVVLLEGDAY